MQFIIRYEARIICASGQWYIHDRVYPKHIPAGRFDKPQAEKLVNDLNYWANF